ncbi:MAG TPA: DUF1517 domain-containing protein [Stenomitos sp.]
MKHRRLNYGSIGCAVALAGLTAAVLEIHPSMHSTPLTLEMGQPAIAKSSGGRAGGGSFRRVSPPSSSGRRSAPNYAPNYPRQNYGGGGGPVFVPIPYGQPNYNTQPYSGGPGYSSSSQGGFASVLPGLLVLLILGGLSIGAIVWLLPKLRGLPAATGEQEITNNIFTVTRLQVALYAQARQIQTDLSELSETVDTETQSGLLQLMQESALALLRQPESWTHAKGTSQTVKDALAAEQLINQLSVEVRSKLSSETLVNVGGRVRRNSFKAPGLEEDPAAYIVVTLLIGTAHDRALFEQVNTAEDLKRCLEQLAGLPEEYLMTLEVIWSPQEASDSLTEEELLTEYSDLKQI